MVADYARRHSDGAATSLSRHPADAIIAQPTVPACGILFAVITMAPRIEPAPAKANVARGLVPRLRDSRLRRDDHSRRGGLSLMLSR